MSEWDIRNDEALVSICVLAYNHGAYIEECLRSLLAQKTDFPYEICIGEDESSDETREICKKYAAENPDRIRLFLRSRDDVVRINGKATGRFNFIETLNACRSRYVAICEGDDYWSDPEKLQVQVRALEDNPDCALCFCNVQVVYDDGQESHPGYGDPAGENRVRQVGMFVKPPEKTNILQLAKGNYIHMPGVLFRNWLRTDPFPAFLLSVEFGDWPLHMCTARRGDIIFIDQVFSVYRAHAGGMWSSTDVWRRLAATVRVGCRMMQCGEFGEEVVHVLRSGVCARLRRLWKVLLDHPENGFQDSWFSTLALDFPSIQKTADSYARKYRNIGLYRFIRRLKKRRRN